MVRLLIALCAAGAFLGAAAGEVEAVRIGLVRSANAGPLYISVAAGYFTSEGLDPQVEFLPSDADVTDAVASRRVDIGLAALSAPFYREAADHYLKIIASEASDQTGFPMYAFLLGAKTAQLRSSGARRLLQARFGVAETEPGAYYGLFSAASRFKIAPEHLQVQWLKSPDQALAALSHGDIDAAVVPFETAIQSDGKDAPLVRLSDLTTWQQSVVFAAAEKIAGRRQLIERFVRAYRRGTADYRLNFLEYDDGGDFIPGPRYREYLDVIAHQSHTTAALLARTKTYCDPRANLDVADIQRQVKFWQDQGRLDRRIAAGDLLDLSFIGANR